MKARIKKDNSKKVVTLSSGTGPYHGHPIRLTIGMIVKDEEKTLDRCLSSLKPLMEAVESELIITDTGSTDGTVEIAKQYTDHIIHFEWCDDFSAARNTGLKEARGEWFMFLDGDEWFENTDELIEFFTSGECDKYGTAAYIQRNYSDDDGTKYADFQALRITRMYPNVHFKNIVHEDFGRLNPVKFLKDYVHHYGYVFHNEEEKKEKLERNAVLLERELENNPNDIKAYVQLTKQYLLSDRTKAEMYCRKGLAKLEGKNKDTEYRMVLVRLLMIIIYNSEQYGQVLEQVEQIENQHLNSTYWLDFCSFAQSAAFHLEDYQKSLQYGRRYLDLYERFRKDELDREFELVETAICLDDAHREQVVRLLVETDLKLGDIDKVWDNLGYMNLSEEKNIPAGFLMVRKVCDRTKDWEKLTEFYQKVYSGKNEEYLPNICMNMESLLLSRNESEKTEAIHALAGISTNRDPYVRLCRLREAETEESAEAARNEINWFLRWDGEWNPLFSDVLFYAMKEKVNLIPLILKIDSEDLKYYAVQMGKLHPDLPEVIRIYSDSYSFDDIRGIYWAVCLREKVLLSKEGPFKTEKDEIQFFEEYARQTAKYVRALYRPELLLSERISVLPRAHRFGYYMGLALSARDRADGKAYLSNLRLALDCYPVMKRQISLLLEQFKREEKLREEKAKEFQRLAGQAKEQIEQMISQGKLKEAGQVTAQLAALLPEDPDVVRFRTLTHTEPDMKELAARLPQ